MSDTPDFDSMSPEEMMKWMESLAVRQGASEGLTTDADMEIEEVDEADARLEGMGEYKPYGMSDDDWAKMQEKEAAEKAAKLAQQAVAPPPPPPAPEPVPEPVAQVEPEPVAGAEPAMADAVASDTPDFDSMSPEEMMEWMESLAKRQGADEGFTTSASMQVAEVDESDARLEGVGEYKPYGMSDDDWAKMQEKEAAKKAAKLANQQATPDEVFEAVEEYEYEDDDEYVEDDEEFFEVAADRADLNVDHFESLDETQADEAIPSFDDILPAEPVAEAESPMDWLAGLSSGEEEAPELEFNMDALADLGALGEAESTGDPMEWLATLSGDDADTLPDLSALAGDSDEGSLEWMESLASDEGAESEELFTAASLDIPIPDELTEDGPGYEEFSFEEATGMVQDSETVTPVQADTPEMSLEDPEGWLDSLASGEGNEIPDDIFSGGNEIIDEDDEDYEDAEQFDSHADVVKAQMDSGNLGDNPDDINKFFQSAFSRAATRDDVPDYIDSEDDDVDIEDVEMPVQAEIPDWLQESMSSVPAEAEEEPVSEKDPKTATAEMMIASLGLEEDAEETEIPEWLSGDINEDTGIIENDIFDDVVLEEAEAALEAGITDTQDTWVEAFNKEDSEEIETWYEGAVADLDGEAGAVAEAVADVSLQSADLPVESKLAEGSPQNVPDWMAGDSDSVSSQSSQSVEVAAAQDDDMDWLDETVEEAIDMPDWLQATVDDSITEDEDLPDWLEGETNIEARDIPDWLRETMDEEEATLDSPFPVGLLEEEAPAQIVAPTPAPLPVPVQQSPAPVPVSADKVDAVAFLRSAKDKIEQRDIEGAMLDYEQVIRANKALPQVEKELQRLVEDNSYKKNPAINRVLGDVLMRQGKLQDALNIYRKALNLL